MNDSIESKRPTQHSQTLKSPWRVRVDEIAELFGVDSANGLSHDEVAARQARYGLNELQRTRQRSITSIAIDQFKSLIVALLAAAAALSFLFAQWLEGVAILVVLVINALIGFFTELKAMRSMEALFKLTETKSRVLRAGQKSLIPAKDLVPGDVVVLEPGDLVMADMRLIEANNIEADESTLTGESAPVAKSTRELDDEHVVLAERSNMLFKGTALTKGTGKAIVIETGMETELGEITALVQEAESERTPLEHKLDNLGNVLIAVALGVAAVVALIGIARDRDIFTMVETGIALAVAAVPEGLPIVATIALAQGVWRMAQRNALIRRLSAVETLGEADVICVDKTGTITENHMTLTTASTEGGNVELDEIDRSELSLTLERFLEIGALCNTSSLASQSSNEEAERPKSGDPIEIALLEAAGRMGLRREDLLSTYDPVREVPFDADVKMMATYFSHTDGLLVAVKGAPEDIIHACSHVLNADGSVRELDDKSHNSWHKQNEKLARSGLRVLALAYKEAAARDDEPYGDLILVGLGGFLDPPREGVRSAIEQCKAAGIHVVMVTGDQPETALAIAREVGLSDDRERLIHGRDFPERERLTDDERDRVLKASIFARFTPVQKLDLIEIHQKAGSVVAMTGDGVNDAPALKKADIGIAMGRRGTQVAEEAAEMILKDDAFDTIVEATRQGRVIFSNIRKFVLYLLSCNLSEILIVGVATLLSGPLPLLPLQILFLNLVTDVFPALALGVGPGDDGVMGRPPRQADEPILRRSHWTSIGSYGLLITVSVLTAFFIALHVLELQESGAVTISFLTLAFAQLWHVFNMRAVYASPVSNQITQNPFIWGALLICTLLTLLAVYVPLFADVLHISPPDATGWALILGMSLVPLVGGNLLKAIARS